MNHFKNAFRLALAADETNQKQWARSAGVRESDLSKLTGGQLTKINDKLWRALCNHWQNPKSGLLILEARLKDEIERSGRLLSEIYPVIASETPPVSVGEDLQIIDRFVKENPDLYRIIAMMADSVRQANAPKPDLNVAVDNPEGGQDTNVAGSQTPKQQVEKRKKPKMA